MPPSSPTPTTAPVPPDEQRSDVLSTMDARAWAAEFMKITGGAADESAMLAWFANALMCGWDHHYWQSDEYKREVARFLGSDTMANPTPTHSAPVPPINPVIITRLRELSLAVTEERWSEFSMSIPIRRHRDADVVLADAADWIAQSLSEREELAGLIMRLRNALLEDFYLGELGDQAFAAAERLRGGGNDA